MGMEHGQKLREFLGWKFEDDVSGETFVVMDFLYIIIIFFPGVWIVSLSLPGSIP